MTRDQERAASMARHPAGRRGTQPLPAPALAVVADPKVVYTTSTGEEPRGGPSLTDEATSPLPAPTKRIRKHTTKKRAPRVKAGSVTELHRNVKVDPRIMAEVKRVVGQGVYTKVTIVDAETVIIR